MIDTDWERATDLRHSAGTLADGGDPVAAWDEWYRGSDRPWRDVTDVEMELGRNQDSGRFSGSSEELDTCAD